MDVISRQDAIDALRNHFTDGFEEDRWWNSTHVLAALKDVPPVQKTGYWINRSLNILYPEWERYICSSCGKCSDNYDYCPNCGSRMEREEE